MILKLKQQTSLMILMLVFAVSTFAGAQPVTPNKLPKGSGPWIVLAHYQDKQAVLGLKPYYDLWKIDEKNKTVLMAVENVADFQELAEAGFSLVLHEALMRQQQQLKNKSLMGLKTIDGFACYRTVTETFAAMDQMLLDYPGLVTLVDIGDSWEKTQNASQGHDMQVVKITNSAITTADKPILYAMGSIHSREYPPAELVTRFAEYLLSEYGDDADVTWLVDHHEIHLLLQGNPDGRIVSEGEATAFQRKNYNANHCEGGGGFGDMQGVDMNRNFEFLWNQGTGSSGNDCSSAFRGDTAASEPETQAINNYIQTLFPDDRPDDLVTAAPLTKPGVYLDIHNVAELTLFPWGYADNAGQSPNHVQLQTLARKMSFFTGYRPEQSNASLGGADGASDDNAYGTLGVAAYTIELGEGGFYSSCSSFDNTIWPDNRPAMIYAAKAARMPYVMASGPDVINLPPQPIKVSSGQTFNVSGTATDLQFNNSNGLESTQNISGIKAYLGTPSWSNGATAVDMVASDGVFDSKTEAFNGVLDSSGLSEGRHIVWFEATDSAGVTGVPHAVFVDVLDPGNIATLSGTVTDGDTSAAIEAATVSYDGITVMTDASGSYSIQTAATTSDLSVSKLGYLNTTLNDVATIGGQTTTQDVQLTLSCDVELLNTDVESYNSIADAEVAGWSRVTGAGNNDWDVVNGDDQTTGNSKSFVAADVATVSDKSLVTPELAVVADTELVFWHKHDFESNNDNYDGGVLEITTNNGSSWTDLGQFITQNGYNGTLNGGFSQPLGAVPAFVGNLGTFTEVKVDLSAFAGQNAKVRWRLGTDNSTSAGDWKIDDISVLAPRSCKGPDDLIFADGFDGSD
ncbi:M14 family zinc carboxypeptidase [Marinicella sp. S1101]|uniref:M14 family zinc carboxypeptidase n=1 Tax=Marinicella marina TaxID=2996016 RepID=UPI0022609F56|nr:M14 family zinc carboxypeptidase [Marinicella marina]MCX7554619.1 M14 family zinc carboxypeptidase [Marinicella marina]MDJ1140684.1 M14 family zinc carboxypeptidase [Marinicella marina]